MRSVKIEFLERRVAGRASETEGDGRRIGRMQEQAYRSGEVVEVARRLVLLRIEEGALDSTAELQRNVRTRIHFLVHERGERLLIHRRRKHLLARHVEVAIEHPGAYRSLQPARRLVLGKHLQFRA